MPALEPQWLDLLRPPHHRLLCHRSLRRSLLDRRHRGDVNSALLPSHSHYGIRKWPISLAPVDIQAAPDLRGLLLVPRRRTHNELWSPFKWSRLYKAPMEATCQASKGKQSAVPDLAGRW